MSLKERTPLDCLTDLVEASERQEKRAIARAELDEGTRSDVRTIKTVVVLFAICQVVGFAIYFLLGFVSAAGR